MTREQAAEIAQDAALVKRVEEKSLGRICGDSTSIDGDKFRFALLSLRQHAVSFLWISKPETRFNFFRGDLTSYQARIANRPKPWLKMPAPPRSLSWWKPAKANVQHSFPSLGAAVLACFVYSAWLLFLASARLSWVRPTRLLRPPCRMPAFPSRNLRHPRSSRLQPPRCRRFLAALSYSMAL